MLTHSKVNGLPLTPKIESCAVNIEHWTLIIKINQKLNFNANWFSSFFSLLADNESILEPNRILRWMVSVCLLFGEKVNGVVVWSNAISGLFPRMKQIGKNRIWARGQCHTIVWLYDEICEYF